MRKKNKKRKKLINILKVLNVLENNLMKELNKIMLIWNGKMEMQLQKMIQKKKMMNLKKNKI